MDINPIGVNPAFRAVDELIRPTDLLSNNLARLKKGSFYLTGLSLKVVSTGNPFNDAVVKSVDGQATKVSAETVYRYLHFPNGITEDVYVTYYYYDGKPEAARDDFLSTLDALDSEDTQPDYRAVQDKPFALGINDHQHNVNVLYGLEGVGLALITLLNKSVASLDNVLSSVLVDIQSNVDNRLKTTDKTIVGAINEIVNQIANVDLSQIQAVSSQSLNTADKTIVGAINELKTKATMLQSLTTQGLTFAGVLDNDVTLSTDGNKSKLWAVVADCTVSAYWTEAFGSRNVVAGDIVYLDGTIQRFLHHDLGSKMTMLIAGDYTVTTDNNPAVNLDPKTVVEALALIKASLDQYSYNDPSIPLLGTLVGNIDLSQNPAANTGYYLVGKSGISVTVGSPSVTLTPNVSDRIVVTQGTNEYAIESTPSILASELSHLMPDTGEVRVIKALEKVETELAIKVSTYGNGIEYAGYLTGGTYNFTSASGTFLMIVTGTQCDVILPLEGDATETVTLNYGDMLYRKQSTGKYLVARTGTVLSGQLDSTSYALTTPSKDVIQALLGVADGILYHTPIPKNITTLTVNGNGEYVLPDPTPGDKRQVWKMDVTGTVYAKWGGSSTETAVWREVGTLIVPHTDGVTWNTTIGINGTNYISTQPLNGSGEYVIPAPDSSRPKEVWVMDITGTVLTRWGGQTEDLAVWREKGTILIPNSTFTGWTTLGKTNGTWIDVLNRCYDSFTGQEKTVAAEINRVRETILGSNEIIAGDLIVTGELKPIDYALPCDGRTYAISKYPVLGTLMKDLPGGDGKSVFRMPIKRHTLLPMEDLLINHKYLSGYNSGYLDRVRGSSGEMAVSKDGRYIVFLDIGTTAVRLISTLDYSVISYSVPIGLVNSVISVGDSSFYIVTNQYNGEGVLIDKLIYRFDPDNTAIGLPFVLVRNNVPSAYGTIISDPDDDSVLYQTQTDALGDSQLFRLNLTDNANTFLPNAPLRMNGRRTSLSMYDRKVYWASDTAATIHWYDVSDGTSGSFNLSLSAPLDANAIPYGINFNSARGLFGVIFESSTGNATDYTKMLFWYDVNFSLVFTQKLDTSYDNPVVTWNKLYSSVWNPITDALCGVVANDAGTPVLVFGESRLEERYYLKT